MDIYQNLFNIFPEAQSIALAGLYGLKKGNLDEFKLSDNIYIVAKKDEFDQLYHPRLSNHIRKPDYYLVGISKDNRYGMAFRKIENIEDILASISIAHQMLCVFHNAPYGLGQIHGFLLGSQGSYGISDPAISGRNSEFDNEMFKQDTMLHSFNYPNNGNMLFDNKLTDFFNQVAKAYVETKEKRWILAAIKYTSGMNKFYAEDVILDFAVALESLLTLDKEQIGYKLRLYLALLVGDSYSERVRISEDVKKFYIFRSKFVHGSQVRLTEEHISNVERIGNYLSKALIKTCGKNIERDLIKELEFMSLLGAPKIIKEKELLIVTEKEIVGILCKEHGISLYTSYTAYLSKNDDPDDDYTELLIDIFVEEETVGTFCASMYISHSEDLKNINKLNYWLSQDIEKGYFYYVNFSRK